MSTDSIVQSIGVGEAQQLIADSGTLVLDVRTPGEFETSHIAGAINIPVDRLDPHLREIVSRAGGTMLVVCQSGGRAEQAAGKLAQTGKQDLVLLEGGMNSWEAAGAPLERGEVQRWSLERQVRLVAGSIVFISVMLGIWVPGAHYVAGAVGFGLVFAALTNTCMMGMLLAKLPYNRGPGCDIDRALERLGAR